MWDKDKTNKLSIKTIFAAFLLKYLVN